jgi:hypothetical protein
MVKPPSGTEKWRVWPERGLLEASFSVALRVAGFWLCNTTQALVTVSAVDICSQDDEQSDTVKFTFSPPPDVICPFPLLVSSPVSIIWYAPRVLGAVRIIWSVKLLFTVANV